MKKTPIIIAVLVIVVLVAIISTGNKKKVAPVPPENTVQLVAPAGAQSVADTTYVIDPGSRVKWSGSKKIITDWIDTGTVGISSGEVAFSGGSPVSGTMTFDMNTIASDSTGKGSDADSTGGLAQHLKSADWFDVQNYPTSTFVFTRAVPATDVATSHRYTVTGRLTMKGITQEVTSDMLMYQNNGKLIMSGSFPVDRTLWDIRFGSDKFASDLGDNVINDMFNVSFDLSATPREMVPAVQIEAGGAAAGIVPAGSGIPAGPEQ